MHGILFRCVGRRLGSSRASLENPEKRWESRVVRRRKVGILFEATTAAMRRSVIALAVACAVSAAGSARAADIWPVYLHDVQHTGRAAITVDPTLLEKTPAWSAPAGYSIPLVVGERVYAMRSQFGISDDLTSIACFALGTGEVLWEKTENLIFPSALAYHDGRIIYTEIDQFTFEYSLVVRDAESGEVVYRVAIPNALVLLPTVYEDPVTGEVVAYLSAPAYTNFGVGPSMTAVTLGETSGEVKWADSIGRQFDDVSFPTIVETSLVVAGPAHFQVYDLASGVTREFYSGGLSGGGGATAACDTDRLQFYIIESMGNEPSAVLSAWRYSAYDDIELAWTADLPVMPGGEGVAIDARGYVWVPAYTELYKVDPTDGHVVGSAGGQFASGMTPIISGNWIWTYESGSDTVVYDVDTLDEVARFGGSRGDLNSAFGAPGAFGQGAFLLDHGRIYDYPGFDVFLASPCGNAIGERGTITASDALAILRVSVGSGACEPCVCDVDSSGEVQASDALAVLRKAVGDPVPFSCTPCG